MPDGVPDGVVPEVPGDSEAVRLRSPGLLVAWLMFGAGARDVASIAAGAAPAALPAAPAACRQRACTVTARSLDIGPPASLAPSALVPVAVAPAASAAASPPSQRAEAASRPEFASRAELDARSRAVCSSESKSHRSCASCAARRSSLELARSLATPSGVTPIDDADDIRPPDGNERPPDDDSRPPDGNERPPLAAMPPCGEASGGEPKEGEGRSCFTTSAAE